MIEENGRLEKAVEALLEKNATCVIITDNEMKVSHERGVKPLLMLIDQNCDVCGGVSADKVVGKAAAMLYILLGIGELYACVISELALKALSNSNIKVRYDKVVPMIRNRTDTGFCPMEQAVKDIDEPTEALRAIKITLKALSEKK